MSAADRVRPEILALDPYGVPAGGQRIKLDAMENPFAWPDEELRAAWLDTLAGVELNRYPDPRAPALHDRLRRHLGIADPHRLVLGNGSDELIQLIILALARPGATALAPEPTFVMYRMIARFCGVAFHGVPLAAEFALDVDAMRAAMAAHDPAVVFLAWPNNPTGNLWSRADVRRVIEAAPGLVVIDEAYQPFAAASLIDELGDWPNVVLLRTLSKLGLAGLRLGLAIGPAEWLDPVDKLRLPYNVNTLTQASAAFALDHFARLEQQAATIRAERERLAGVLGGLPGVRVYPSAANFLLVETRALAARALFDALLADGIRVKCLDGSHPRLAGCLRLTIGTPGENALLEDSLRRHLGAA